MKDTKISVVWRFALHKCKDVNTPEQKPIVNSIPGFVSASFVYINAAA